jgi:hypothetical protein
MSFWLGVRPSIRIVPNSFINPALPQSSIKQCVFLHSFITLSPYVPRGTFPRRPPIGKYQGVLPFEIGLVIHGPYFQPIAPFSLAISVDSSDGFLE